MSFRCFCLLGLSAVALAACASITDTPNQQVQVLTPGAENARCTLESDRTRMVAYPPERIFMRRSSDPIKITCSAPGNRERTQMVYPSINTAATPNAAVAGLGGIYDHFSGALYEYPSPIVVDFRFTVTSERSLPTYHTPDTVSPFDHNGEDMRDSQGLHPDEYQAPGPTPAPFKPITPEPSLDDTIQEDDDTGPDVVAPPAPPAPLKK